MADSDRAATAPLPITVDQLLDQMLRRLTGEAGAAIVSWDLHDLPGWRPAGIEQLADVLLTACARGGLVPAQCRLLAMLDDSDVLTTTPPLGWPELGLAQATLYLFTLEYVQTLAADREEYRRPLARLRRPGGTVLVTYSCGRPAEGIEHRWEYSRCLDLSIDGEPHVASH